VTPEEVVAGWAPETAPASACGVARDARLPRLLVVRVGPRWDELDDALRGETAEAWRELWRHAVPDGILAVTDESGRSRIGFDAAGGARLLPPP
jgi:hypothetical protein